MSRLDKHLECNNTVKINDEDFVLKGLGSKYAQHYLTAMKLFKGLKEDSDPTAFMDNITPEISKSVEVLITDTLVKSLPDEDKEKLSEFGMKYMMILLPKIIEINSPKDIETVKKKELKDRLAPTHKK